MPLGETLYAYFPMGPNSLPVVVAQPDERLAKKPKKSALRWCGWTDAACLVHTNKQANKIE